MEEKPLTKPLALTSSWALVSPSMDAGLDQAPFSPSKTAWNTSEPPMRSKRNSSHIMLVHRDCPPREMGATPASLNFGTRLMMSPQDWGGWTPTFSKTFLFQ
jgi:hypothetical protein